MERKQQSLQRLTDFMDNHVKYHLPHMSILVQVEAKVVARIYNAKLIYGAICNFVSCLQNSYHAWACNLGKTQANARK